MRFVRQILTIVMKDDGVLQFLLGRKGKRGGANVGIPQVFYSINQDLLRRPALLFQILNYDVIKTQLCWLEVILVLPLTVFNFIFLFHVTPTQIPSSSSTTSTSTRVLLLCLFFKNPLMKMINFHVSFLKLIKNIIDKNNK